MKKLLLLLVVAWQLSAFSQENKQKFGIKLSGFINTEAFWDSRQVIAAREGDVLLYPANEKMGTNNKDINAKANFNMLSVFSRIKTTVSVPDVFGAKTTGVIEMDFAGNSDARVNTPRMRHAFIKLAWEKMELITGQYWHPIFAADCYPEVLHWGGGLPMAPLSRAPQIRVTLKPTNKFSVSVVALSERDFVSPGPDGANSSYLRNSAMPELQVQVLGSLSKSLKYGFSGGYRTLVPRLSNRLGEVVEEKIGSYNANAFIKYKSEKITFALQGIYGQNMNSYIMLGGYAVSAEQSDIANDNLSYVNLPTSSVWTELGYNFASFNLTLFAGYTKNHGADEDVVKSINYTTSSGGIETKSTVYTRGGDIDYVYRFAPRLSYKVGRFRFGTEFVQTTAAYGTANNQMQVEDTKEVTNYRVLFSSFLSF